MERITTILIAIMMATVSLAGCSGDDSGYEDTISSMEQDAIADQAMMAALNATISTLTVDLETLGTQITGLDSQIADLQTEIESLSLQNSTKANQIELMTLNMTTLVNAKALLEAQVLVLDSEKALLEAQVSSLTASNQDAATDIAELQALSSQLNQTIQQLESTISDMENSGSSISSTLDTIIDRGTMKCGVKSSQYGMGYTDSSGVRSGLDITYCRAVAAAIGLDPDTDVEYILASGSTRFQMLASGTIDVLIRTTTWTASRDADLEADYAGINFYDGQGIMVREDRFSAAAAGNSATALDEATICVGIGTTTEGNLYDWFSSREITFTSVPVADYSEANQKFIDGDCDALTGDASALVARKWQLDNDGSMNGVDIWIATEQMSKEPLAAVTRDYDTEWNDVVEWVWFGMITAEESGVTSSNYAAQANDACATNDAGSTTDPAICRLLTENFGLGTAENPLSGTWMQDVLAVSGNYGEAYDEAFCDGTYDGVSGSDAMSGCLISRAGTLNALVSEGGIQYAPSMR